MPRPCRPTISHAENIRAKVPQVKRRPPRLSGSAGAAIRSRRTAPIHVLHLRASHPERCHVRDVPAATARTVGGSRNITTSGFSSPAPPACGYKLLQDTNATKPKSRDAHSFRAGRCFYLNRTRMTSTRNHIFHNDRKIRFCNESISRMLLLFRGLALLVDSRIRTTNTTLSRDVSIKSISSESRGKSYFL